MALRESGEDYLESIYVLSERQGIVRSIDVAEYLGVTKASVSKAMAALESTGYVEMGKRDVHLTERGLEVARQMWERHCFFVGLLEDAGVTPEVASQEGCHMERGELREVEVDVGPGRGDGFNLGILTDPQ